MAGLFLHLSLGESDDLARIIHDGLGRNRQDAKRDGHAEP